METKKSTEMKVSAAVQMQAGEALFDQMIESLTHTLAKENIPEIKPSVEAMIAFQKKMKDLMTSKEMETLLNTRGVGILGGALHVILSDICWSSIHAPQSIVDFADMIINNDTIAKDR